jgi:hypothetical protein
VNQYSFEMRFAATEGAPYLECAGRVPTLAGRRRRFGYSAPIDGSALDVAATTTPARMRAGDPGASALQISVGLGIFFGLIPGLRSLHSLTRGYHLPPLRGSLPPALLFTCHPSPRHPSPSPVTCHLSPGFFYSRFTIYHSRGGVISIANCKLFHPG